MGLCLGHHNSYRLQASDEKDMQQWISAIRAAMTRDPVFMMLFTKRKGRFVDN